MNILVFDNYDSFTYNLVQMIEQIIGKQVVVAKNDKISIEEINAFDKIIISPGPGIPNEAGNLLEVIQHFADKKPILGVCLGQQAIAEVFGGALINLEKIYHGVASKTEIIAEHSIFKNIPPIFEAGQYHSWAVNPKQFPKNLEITSVSENGIIMSMKHKKYNVHGVQFHPESILTPFGKLILQNFLME